MPAPRSNFVDLTLDDLLDEDSEFENGGRHRTVEIDNNKVHIKCEDPYGFWYVSLQKGQVPDKLKGAYTTFEKALSDVNLWLRNKKEPISSIPLKKA